MGIWIQHFLPDTAEITYNFLFNFEDGHALDFLARFYHTLRFWLVICVLSIVLGTSCVLARCTDRSGNTSHRIASLWGRLICRLSGVRVAISGLEHIDPERAHVFVANHQSYFDIFALTGYLPIQLRWVAKSSLFRIPFVGWAMWAEGSVSVDREDRKSAYRSFLAAIEKIKSGCSIVIFPEGTRSVDGVVGEFKKGGHLLAIRSQAPMVPVAIVGSGGIIKKGGITVRPEPIKIIISPPIAVENLSPEDRDGILDHVRGIICKSLEENAP